jgi:hypothetical protein
MNDALISQLCSAYEAAAGRNGVSKEVIAIGGHRAYLEFASDKLRHALLPSLSGLRVFNQDKQSKDLTIYLWDASHGINFLCHKTKQALQHYLDRHSEINQDNIHLQYNPQGEILSCIDTHKKIAFYFTPHVETLPDYEISAPMRIIMHWFCKMNHLLFVHAAAVGFHGAGALLVGRGGAGKSTTALACLLNGLDYIGDDYIALSTEKNPMGHHVYRGCKISDEALLKLPELAPYAIETNKTQEKNVLMLDENAGRVVQSIPIKMIIRPTICHAVQSSFKPLPLMKLLADFAGSTILQMPGSEPDTLHELAMFCRKTPAYSMLLSHDFTEIAARLKLFLTQKTREIVI